MTCIEIFLNMKNYSTDPGTIGIYWLFNIWILGVYSTQNLRLSGWITKMNKIFLYIDSKIVFNGFERTQPSGMELTSVSYGSHIFLGEKIKHKF